MVVHWKNLTAKGVQESGAYKSTSAYNSTVPKGEYDWNQGAPSKALAESEFTVANGYFYYGEYTRK